MPSNNCWYLDRSSPGIIHADRFTPACAGNTASDCLPVEVFTVHPRVCGEHGVGTICMDGQNGSSPRLRGTLFLKPIDFKEQ